MVIANPIYDVVFKKMMENDRVAKFFIGTLLDEVIEKVEVLPQELIYENKLSALAVFRLDFIATILTESGEHKKVLIEIQKAKNEVDLMRFRNYLAAQYKKEDEINNVKVALPITTIYILGFKLPEIETACLKVKRDYIDQINKSALTTKSDFVEKLTHDSYIVQVGRITNRYQTKLDKLLSIFEQTNFVDDSQITKEFIHEIDGIEMKEATDILHHTGTDPKEKKQIENEEEAWRTVDAMAGGLRNKLIEQTKKLEENNKKLEENAKSLEENAKSLEENAKSLEEKDKSLEEKDKLIQELIRKLSEK
jgi:hypothetical protein